MTSGLFNIEFVYVVRFMRGDHEIPGRKIVTAEHKDEYLQKVNEHSKTSGIVAQSHPVKLPSVLGDLDGRWE